MSRLSLFACLVCLFACLGLASADPITFAVTDTGRFGTLDLGTGGFTAIGGVLQGGYSGIGNLADGTLVGIDGRNNFVQIDATTGAVTTIGPTGINVTTSASLLTGEQFAVDEQNRLYQIDPNTGAGTLVGPTGIPGVDLATFANALAGDDTSLYYIYEQGGTVPVPSTLFQLDLTTGAATPIGPTGAAGIVGGGFADSTFYAYSAGAVHRIFTIDLATGTATDTGTTYPQGFLIFGTNSGEAP